jgi:hypothetical protein
LSEAEWFAEYKHVPWTVQKSTNLFVFADNVFKQFHVDLAVVSSLLEMHTIDLFRLHLRGIVRWVDLRKQEQSAADDMACVEKYLKDVVLSSFLCRGHRELPRCTLVQMPSDFTGHDACSGKIAGCREGDEIAEGGHPIRTYHGY